MMPIRGCPSERSTRLALATGMLVGVVLVFGLATGWAQAPLVELTKTDVTKLRVLDSSEWAALGVRLGASKEAALRTLQGIGNIKVQDESASGRIFVVAPPTGNTVVMSLRITQDLVTAINLLAGFGESLQGDTRLLFRAFDDDSLRYKFLGREDQREAVAGGTKEEPTVDVSYAYFKEGILLHYSVKRTSDGKPVETQREMVLIYPAKAR